VRIIRFRTAIDRYNFISDKLFDIIADGIDSPWEMASKINISFPTLIKYIDKGHVFNNSRNSGPSDKTLSKIIKYLGYKPFSLVVK
jgi:hypothetical protein